LSHRSALAGLVTLGAYGAFAATFRGPRERFWPRMTRTGASLGLAALLLEPSLVRRRPRGREVALGGVIAGSLYVAFQVGDRVARRVLPRGGEEIADIYRLGELRPHRELALRLALVVGPAEELFWRGLLQGSLQRRLGPVRAAVAAGLLYGGAHLVTGNRTLIAAATVAGFSWSGLAAAGVPMTSLVVSHSLWDVWIFLIQPTQRTAHGQEASLAG
jgi:membrane protease YdiL (CAAX protease family)